MKTKLFVLVLVSTQLHGLAALLEPGAPAASPAPPLGPRIRFSETSFDFKKVQPTEKPQHDFVFTNIGDAVLEITDVRPLCGCTTAGLWDRQVPPGRTGKIPLQFNPANFSGPVFKGATVACNDPAQGSISLQFQATVWRPIDLQPSHVYFLPVEGELTSDVKLVRIVSNLEEPLLLEAPQSSSPLFQTDLKTIRPGKEFELRVNYSGQATNASLQGKITIQTSCSNLPPLNLDAVVMPQPPIVAMPQQIVLPPNPLSADYRYPATIRNNSRSPLKLSDPSVNAEGVTVQLEELEPGRMFRLTLGFDPSFRAVPGQAMELAVKSSHPRYPVIRVPITQSSAAGSAPPATVAK